MHLLADQSINLPCAAEQAFDYACDLQNFGQWFPGVLQIQVQDSLAPTDPGKTYLETVAVPLRGQRQVRITVKQAERGRLLVTEGSLRPLLPRMQMQFEPLGPAACRLTWRMHSRSASPLVRLALVPLARRLMQRRAAQGLARLRRRLGG